MCKVHSAHCSIGVTRCALSLRLILLHAHTAAFANSHEHTVLPHRTSLSPACPLRLHNAVNHRGHHRQLRGRAHLFNIAPLFAVRLPRPTRTFDAAEMVTMTNEGEVFEYGVFESVLRCACPAVLHCEQVHWCLPDLSFATSPAGSACMVACMSPSISSRDGLCLTLSCVQQQPRRLHCTSNAPREARGAAGSGAAAARRAAQGRCRRPG